MFRGKITRAVAVAGMTLVLIGSVGTSASASPASFSVSHRHAAGRGALAVAVEGGFTWHNRSVTVNDAWIWVKANECGRFVANGYGHILTDPDPDFDFIDGYVASDFCASSQDIWFFVGDVVLAASDYYGGITRVDIHAWDQTHSANTVRSYFR